MSNNGCPNQREITKKANDGLKHLDKFEKAHPDLASDMNLKEVRKDLEDIEQDGHAAFGGLTGAPTAKRRS
jgi:hypothetical protein